MTRVALARAEMVLSRWPLDGLRSKQVLGLAYEGANPSHRTTFGLSKPSSESVFSGFQEVTSGTVFERSVGSNDKGYQEKSPCQPTYPPNLSTIEYASVV